MEPSKLEVSPHNVRQSCWNDTTMWSNSVQKNHSSNERINHWRRLHFNFKIAPLFCLIKVSELFVQHSPLFQASLKRSNSELLSLSHRRQPTTQPTNEKPSCLDWPLFKTNLTGFKYSAKMFEILFQLSVKMGKINHDGAYSLGFRFIWQFPFVHYGDGWMRRRLENRAKLIRFQPSTVVSRAFQSVE